MDENCGGCCAVSPKFDGVSPDYRHRLWLVIAINASMFLAEMAAGNVADSQAPKADVMGAMGVLALLANLASVLFLIRYKDGDANIRSVWLCSRNDAIGNVAVMIAALGVWGSVTAWPDLIVAAIMATLFLTFSIKIRRQAWHERRVEAGAADASRDAHAFAQAPRGMDNSRGDRGTGHIRNRNRRIDRWDKDID